jgi:hypothetical protein
MKMYGEVAAFVTLAVAVTLVTVRLVGSTASRKVPDNSSFEEPKFLVTS